MVGPVIWALHTDTGLCWPGQSVAQAMVATLELSRGVRTPSETPLTHPCLRVLLQPIFPFPFPILGWDSEANSMAKLHTRDDRHSERGS